MMIEVGAVRLSQRRAKLFQLGREDHAGGLGGAAIDARKGARVVGRVNRDGTTRERGDDWFSEFGERLGIGGAFGAVEGEPSPAAPTCSARC